MVPKNPGTIDSNFLSRASLKLQLILPVLLPGKFIRPIFHDLELGVSAFLTDRQKLFPFRDPDSQDPGILTGR